MLDTTTFVRVNPNSVDGKKEIQEDLPIIINNRNKKVTR